MDLACKGTIAPERLPPSERAAIHHGLRVHYQIIEWSPSGRLWHSSEWMGMENDRQYVGPNHEWLGDCTR